MRNKMNMIKVFAVLLTALFLTHPAQAYAWRGDRDWDHDRHYSRYHISHHYPVYGRVSFGLPRGFLSISIGGSPCFYSDGIFYRRAHEGYVVIAPPVGVVVDEIPWGCHRVIVNGRIYYTNGNVYYQSTRDGYVVVDSPLVVAPSQVTVINTPQTDPNVYINNNVESFTVNIPNHRGGYTAVSLQRSGDGFIGPQGEFYPDFPSVEQLKVMYAK